MKVNINSIHFKTDRKLTDFINDKVGKLSSMYDGVISSDVTLKMENSEAPENKIAEIRLIIRGHDLYAKKQCKTFEEATDIAVEALRRQLTKRKAKIRNR
ncbi:MAG: ribosome-associated translation inhibitor RaiA [Bacteroidetes bacterium]|nr:ribosome-associated translation inhibitor RaiA [Bacteroidota bacterium]